MVSTAAVKSGGDGATMPTMPVSTSSCHGTIDLLQSPSMSDNVVTLQAQVELLQFQLKHARHENDRKDRLIASLQEQLRQWNDEAEIDTISSHGCCNGEGHAMIRTSSSSTVCILHGENDDCSSSMRFLSPPLTASPFSGIHSTTKSNTCSSNDGYKTVNMVVDQIQRWLFVEGSQLRDVESLLTEYCTFCRTVLDVPVDRLFVAGMIIYPQVSAYAWTWESGQDFSAQEVPHEAFIEPNYNPNEPFAVLMEGKAMEYRIKRSQTKDDAIPPGCTWYSRDGYQDYLALPMYHLEKFVGAMAWSTKDEGGFTNEHNEVFHQSLAALSTVLRLQTHEIILTTLTGRLEQKINHRTRELAETNERLSQANQQILQQSKAQLQHFAMMSHEIRTPLNCIIGLSNLLLEESQSADTSSSMDHDDDTSYSSSSPERKRRRLDPQVEESIRMITNSGDLLLAIVDDVLDYSKLACGKVDIDVAPTDIRKMLQLVVESIRLKTQINGAKLRTNIADDLPEFIDTDGRRLQQILYNLLGNSAKFGIGGQYVDLTVAVERVDKNGQDGQIKFYVKDYGKGIAETDMKNIFQPFQQASTNEPSDGGTGLGLAITSQLCKVLGGNVSVTSEQGSWCEFVVTLPLKVSTSRSKGGCARNGDKRGSFRKGASFRISESFDAAKDEEIEPLDVSERLNVIVSPNNTEERSVKIDVHTTLNDNPAHEPPFTTNARVLIAEDNEINQKVLERTLRRIGLSNIDIVENGQLAVEQSAKVPYDIIFMDWCMPVMDGLEATRVIHGRRKQGNGTNYHPRIVFLTAHALKEYQEKALEAGGDGFISKPFKTHSIKQLLEKFQLGRQQDVQR